MIQLFPIEVPAYLIPFIIKEMGGVSVLKQTDEFTRITIDPSSIMGMFLRKRILPEKKIKHYCLTVYSKRIGNYKAFSAEMMEFQSSAEFKVDLSFTELESFYKFLDSTFRMSFYFFVKGFCYGATCKAKIKEAITLFCEKYDLLEYGFNENQLRRIYLQYQKKGGAYKFKKNERIGDLFYS